jgi:hypothetical protein
MPGFPLKAVVGTLVLINALLIGNATGAQSQSASPIPSKQQSASGPHAKSSLRAGVYASSHFGFSYQVPFGWVERTAEMGQADSGQSENSSKAQVLLAVFERPPQAVGSTVNSAVVIAAESVSSYPGLKSAVDYCGPLEDATTARGFKVVNEPYEFSIGARRVVREDFSKQLDKLTMQQASLVILEKGYVVSFTFIGSSDDEIAQLIERLSFARAAGRRR